ncbi:MAG TPA: nuclear transport factor 2 family protein [Dehalococcoidales bacterium]|nr:nuclear transport factor 2 family protein [Dehalococcoidales bacterium]
MSIEDLESRITALEKKVLELEDIEKIKILHREYLYFISNLQFDEALDCFTDNIVADVADYGIRRGKTEVTRFFNETIYNNVAVSRDAHFTGQAVITLDGNTARGHWMFYRLLAKPTVPGWVQGRYDCEYTKVSGEWKFSLIKMKRPWPEFFKKS